MMTQPLSDAQILYKPSKDLLKFIRSLKLAEEKEVPYGVLNICGKAKKEDIKELHKNTNVEYPTILQTSDIEFINSLDLDKEEVEAVKLTPKVVSFKKSDKFLNFEDLTWLHKYIEQQNENAGSEGEHIYFHKLFQGTEIILPKNEEVPRSEELEARCVKLRNQQENQRYRSMTKNVDNTRQHHPEDTISYQMKQINTQLIAVFQFVVSVLTGFTFGFLGIELMIGDLDFGFRLLLGIICALIIALAELYFLAKKLNEDVDMMYQPTAITSNHQNSKVKSE